MLGPKKIKFWSRNLSWSWTLWADLEPSVPSRTFGSFKTLQEPLDHSEHLWTHFWTAEHSSTIQKRSDPLRSLNPSGNLQDTSGPFTGPSGSIRTHPDPSRQIRTLKYTTVLLRTRQVRNFKNLDPWKPLDASWPCKTLQDPSGPFRILQDPSEHSEPSRKHQDPSGSFRIFQDLLGSFRIFQDLSGSFRILLGSGRPLRNFQDPSEPIRTSL